LARVKPLVIIASSTTVTILCDAFLNFLEVSILNTIRGIYPPLATGSNFPPVPSPPLPLALDVGPLPSLPPPLPFPPILPPLPLEVSPVKSS